MSPPAHILEELKEKHIIPRQCVYLRGPYPGRTPIQVVNENGIICEWKEPLPGSSFSGYEGFDLETFYGDISRLNDHVGWMGEVYVRDNIKWYIARIVHSQPYGPENRVQIFRKHTKHLLDLNISLDVVEEPHLSWYAPGYSTLCVMRHVAPLPFETFRKTFRYWIIVNVRCSVEGNQREYQLRDDLLPDTLLPPTEQFFDTIYCVDEDSVRLGLNDIGKEVMKSHIIASFCASNTFEFIWKEFRFRASWWPLLRCCKYIARLRRMVKDRKDYAPPHGRKFVEACNAPMGYCS
jgi:hypothetical protein